MIIISIIELGDRKMKMTIKELAKLANVSVTTVSLVLNEKPSRISEVKKQK